MAAVDKNDQAAMLDSFTDDAIVIGGPCGSSNSDMCVGKAQIQQALRTSSGVQVAFAEAPQVSGEGNIVTFRTLEVFDLPPQATAAGLKRYVERGTATVTNGKISRLALVADVTDPQTVALLRLFASLGPDNGSAGGLVASDGHSLATQSAATQLRFLAQYGNDAPARWVQEHEAGLQHS